MITMNIKPINVWESEFDKENPKTYRKIMSINVMGMINNSKAGSAVPNWTMSFEGTPPGLNNATRRRMGGSASITKKTSAISKEPFL
ncbi:MAG: hypothetical protein IJ198_03110 [Lachnospiraceae bacterium]|nr:hypothetical protein [Lachnospiraceae bacterium]